MIEYIGWKEFYEIEPWGLEVQDGMQANIVTTIANVNRDTKIRPEPFSLTDFMIFGERSSSENEEKLTLLDDDDAQTELLISSLFSGMNIRRSGS